MTRDRAKEPTSLILVFWESLTLSVVVTHLGVEGVVELERLLPLALVQLLRQGGDVEAEGADLQPELLTGKGPARFPIKAASECDDCLRHPQYMVAVYVVLPMRSHPSAAYSCDLIASVALSLMCLAEGASTTCAQ